jgi:hypothetical protein
LTDFVALYRGRTVAEAELVAVPAGRVPKGVPYCINALLAQHLYEAGQTFFLDLSQSL